jgi:hypothetical protein
LKKFFYHTLIIIVLSSMIFGCSNQYNQKNELTPTSIELATSTLIPTVELPVRDLTPIPSFSIEINQSTLPNLKRVASWGEGQIFGSSISKDLSKVAIDSSVNGLQVFDIYLEKELFSKNEFFSALDISPDGKLLALPGENGIQIIDAITGNSLINLQAIIGQYSLTDDFNSIYCAGIKFSPNGKLLAAEIYSYKNDQRQSEVFIWSMPDGTLLKSIVSGFGSGFEFSQDSTMFAYDEFIWNTSDWTRIVIHGLTEGNEFHFVNGDNYIAVRGNSDVNFSISVYDTKDGSFIKNVDSTGCNNFVVMSDSCVIIDVLGGTEVEQIFAISPDGKLGIGEQPLQMFQLDDPDKITSFSGNQDDISGFIKNLAFSSDGSQLLVVNEHKIDLWNLFNSKLEKSILWDSGQINVMDYSEANVYLGVHFNLQYSPNGQLLLADHVLFDAVNGKYLDQLLPMEITSQYRFNELSFLNDNSLLEMKQNVNEGFDYYHISNGQETQKMSINDIGSTSGYYLSPDKNILAVVIFKNGISSISLRRLDDGVQIRKFSCGKGADNVMFSNNSKFIAAVCDTGSSSISNKYDLYVWNIEDGKLVTMIKNSGIDWHNLAFSPDDQLLSVSVHSSNESAELERIYRSSDWTSIGEINSNCFSSIFLDNSTLVCGSANGKIQFWSMSDMSLVSEISLFPEKTIIGLAISPDKNYLATVDNYGVVNTYAISEN